MNYNSVSNNSKSEGVSVIYSPRMAKRMRKIRMATIVTITIG